MKPIWLLTLMAIIGILAMVMGYYESIRRHNTWIDQIVGVCIVFAGFLMAVLAVSAINN